MTVNIHEAKTHLSRLLTEVEKGAEILIARNGTVIARLVSARASSPRKLGRLQNKVKIPNDFDRLGREEIESIFLGKEP